MPRITLLGTSATLAGRDNDSIYLLVASEEGNTLIDCGGSPPHKIARAGASLGQVQGVLLTHDHADHLYGLPLLVQALILLEQAGNWSGELVIWGLQETLETSMALLECFRLADRIPICFRKLPNKAGYVALETAELRITTAPVRHSRPTVGVRLEGKRSGRTLAYSSDTGPCDQVIKLAAGVDVLLHEATVLKEEKGHSTPYQAGEVAEAAKVGELVLVHIDPAQDQAILISEANKAFSGPVIVGRDWMWFDL